jgi:hypothetical protein
MHKIHLERSVKTAPSDVRRAAGRAYITAGVPGQEKQGRLRNLPETPEAFVFTRMFSIGVIIREMMSHYDNDPEHTPVETSDQRSR